MIFDSSVWIDFLNSGKSWQSQHLSDSLTGFHPVIITPTIHQEVLQGIRLDADFIRVKRLLQSLDWLVVDGYVMAEEAADLYRQLRKKGVSIRKSNDCLIAAYAIQSKLEICHIDRDFDLIAKHTTLKIFQR